MNREKYTKLSTWMELQPAEAKLIYRLRQLRKEATCITLILATSPMSLSIMGQIEHLEQPVSGSMTAYTTQ